MRRRTTLNRRKMALLLARQLRGAVCCQRFFSSLDPQKTTRQRDQELVMKKLFISLSLLCLLGSAAALAFGQGRPRRVGDQASTRQSTAPDTASPATTAPTKPPVLGGANYPNNQKPTQQQQQTPAGPEEVGAGDVVRVDTTLV